MFRLFGFDVKVRTGFLIFLALIAFLYPDGFGIWLAGALAGFTLIHELGHAVAARTTGAQAAISLDFMVGYTSFRPTRPLRRSEQAMISIAGPAAQIVVSVAVLLAMGVQPWSTDSVIDGGVAAEAIWWAGPMIGLLNLVPVLPLDGGHLAQTGLEAVLRRPALREMAIASVTVTVAIAALMAITGRVGFVIFIAFLLIGQVQILQATSRAKPAPAPPGAWRNDGFMQGGGPSPWQQAHRQLTAGHPAAAAEAIVADLRRDAGDSSDMVRWAPPSDAPGEALRAIVETLPRPLPDGNAFSQRILAEVMLATGFAREGGEYAASGFGRHRTPLLALVVARAAARMGDEANALQWIHAAIDATEHRSAQERAVVAHVLDRAPELQHLRDEGAFRAGRITLG